MMHRVVAELAGNRLAVGGNDGLDREGRQLDRQISFAGGDDRGWSARHIGKLREVLVDNDAAVRAIATGEMDPLGNVGRYRADLVLRRVHLVGGPEQPRAYRDAGGWVGCARA